jgi:tRNA wybutosine-synthesizing protein 3
MDFEKQKQEVLSRADKSIKGSIDAPIKHLVDLINSLEDYYTSSSCSGRITLMEIDEERKKLESNWLFVKHDFASFEEIKDILKEISEKQVWFMQESMILHICCRNFEKAVEMIKKCHQAGLKRAGIITYGKKIMVEAFAPEKIETIIADKGKLFIDPPYLNILVKEANKKYEKNLQRIERLYNMLKSP